MKLNLTGEKKYALYETEIYSLKTDIIHQFSEHPMRFDLFSAATNLDELVKLLVDDSNSYVQKNEKWEHF